jgi:Lrp/AsnC family transcriptional regulator, regulator for asnA, asnC and gidA
MKIVLQCHATFDFRTRKLVLMLRRMASGTCDGEALLDELDRLILGTLQKDGRTPFTRIAEQARVSEATIRSRYYSLVEQGIVRTVAVVDPAALGFDAPALIGVSVDTDKIDGVSRAIAAFPEVSYLVMTLGSWDLTVEVFCRDLSHLTDFITRKLGTIGGVRSTETLMIARSYKLSYCWSPDAQDGAPAR